MRETAKDMKQSGTFHYGVISYRALVILSYKKINLEIKPKILFGVISKEKGKEIDY